MCSAHRVGTVLCNLRKLVLGELHSGTLALALTLTLTLTPNPNPHPHPNA